MKVIVLRLMATILLLVAAVLLAMYVLLRASLPDTDGSIPLAGIVSGVVIDRDEAGVVTVTGKHRADVAFATGFVHAQDRYFQMDLSRRSAAGELAELFGPLALEADKSRRLHRFRARAAQALERLPVAEKALLDSYVAGVNAGLSQLRRRPFEYDLLRLDPSPWLPVDSLLVVYSMYLVLNDELALADVRRGLARSALPTEVFDWMYPTGTPWDAPVVGEPTVAPSLPGPGVFDLSGRRTLRRAGAIEDASPVLPGSNNWAVAGALTKDGRAMVANDMHLPLGVPNVFYRLRLRVAGQSDVAGVSLPGMPLVVAGSNGRVAWGFTNSYGDWSDAVIVRPGPLPDSYVSPTGIRRIREVSETIRVRGAPSEDLVVRETHWGPVLPGNPYPGKVIAVRWIAHDSNAFSLAALALETVQSARDALAIANRIAMPPQNFVCGDADGNIGWTIAGRIPTRSNFDARLPSDWSQVEGWTGWLPADAYPRIENPVSGRLWTANGRVVDGEALRKVGFGGYDLGARAQQIRDDLSAQQVFDAPAMLRIQLDDRALFLARWRGLLLELLDDEAVAAHPDRARYRDLVDNWIPRASIESVGYRLVREYRNAVRERVFDMLTAPVREVHGDDVILRISNQFEAPLWQLVTERPNHLLSADHPDWRSLLLGLVDEEIARLVRRYDDVLENRSWGERNTVAIRHPLSRTLGPFGQWLDMPAVPQSGDEHMPKAMAPAFGASERFAVSPGDEQRGYLHMPTGQSGHPLSPYYRAGHDDWVQGVPSPFLPGPAARTLTLTPAR